MFKGVESILVTRQETIILPKTEPTVTKPVLVVVKIKYNEPKLNQHNGSIIRGIPRDWN
jgi:hypothetical protein